MAEWVDLDELERLAKAAIETSDRLRTEKPTRRDADMAYARAVTFAKTANPATVLALVAELRELRGRYGKDGEVWCGARRDQAGSAYCVEMAGHERDGVTHMWGQHADPSTHDRSGSG